jgi:hypothetical protein
VTVLLERALRRRTITIKGWQFALRWPTWPLCALWINFGGSVSGNVAHAPQVLAAQLVAAVPPISAALTFHLLLRLLDRAPALRAIAEAHEERGVEERERAARRQARRAQLKTQRMDLSPHVVTPAVNGTATRSSNGDDGRYARGSQWPPTDGRARGRRSRARGSGTRQRSNDPITVHPEDLSRRVQTALAAGDRVTGEIVGQWLGVSARTGRRRLAALLEGDPALAHAIEHTHAVGRAQPPSAMRR